MLIAAPDREGVGRGGVVGELSEEEIEAAQVVGSTHHGHEQVSSQDDTLAEHLRRLHALDPPATLSRTTLEGLHDRLHDEAKATEDQC
ncbi:MAG: hypothetical protein M3N11_08025 [Actinomycetota bacterium]|nr:hypothetical protein [Actinomycetota bacterium]